MPLMRASGQVPDVTSYPQLMMCSCRVILHMGRIHGRTLQGCCSGLWTTKSGLSHTRCVSPHRRKPYK